MAQYLTGLSLFAQTTLIQVCAGLLANTVTPLQDPAGAPISVPMSADLPDPSISSPCVHVGVELGPTNLPNDYGTIGTTADGRGLLKAAWNPDSAGVFTVYAPNDVLRRHLADWLQWGIMTAYIVYPGSQGPSVGRQDAYILHQLRAAGLHPAGGGRRLFEKPEFPEPKESEPRPHGLPYRAIVRLRFDLQVVWATSGYSPTTQLTVAPTNPPASVYPIVIPLPYQLPTPHPGE